MAYRSQITMIIAVFALVVGCAKKMRSPAHTESSSMAKDTTRSLTTREASIRGHEGKDVRLRGRVDRAKLGDVIQGSGFSVYCLDKRFPESLLGTEITVTGRLTVRDFSAKEQADGSITQGTAPGTLSYVLENCELAQ